MFELTDRGRQLLATQPGLPVPPLPQLEPPRLDDSRWYRAGDGDLHFDDVSTGNRWRREKSGRLHVQRAGMAWEHVTSVPTAAPIPVTPVQWTDPFGRVWHRGVAGDTWTWDLRSGVWLRVA